MWAGSRARSGAKIDRSRSAMRNVATMLWARNWTGSRRKALGPNPLSQRSFPCPSTEALVIPFAGAICAHFLIAFCGTLPIKSPRVSIQCHESALACRDRPDPAAGNSQLAQADQGDVGERVGGKNGDELHGDQTTLRDACARWLPRHLAAPPKNGPARDGVPAHPTESRFVQERERRVYARAIEIDPRNSWPERTGKTALQCLRAKNEGA